MSSAVQLGRAQLIPVKEAAEFVPYSRDYVARLAREGKVVAVQIDRQWFVDVVSLQNFFVHATIEEEVRKRHLSTKRKRDLEVKEVYQNRLAVIAEKRHRLSRSAFLQTCFILLCGLGTGLFFTTANDWADSAHLQTLAQIFSRKPMVQTASVAANSADQATTLQAVDTHVHVTDESLDVRRGIVVLPENASSTSGVEDFFSDPVTVHMTSTTTGEIKNSVSNETLPFVKVPNKTVVVPAEQGNAGTP
jgi:hypothetical protein